MTQSPVNREILALRQQVDQINKDLADLFMKRLEMIEKISRIKVQQELPIHDVEREKSMLKGTLEAYSNIPQKKWVKLFLVQVFSLSLEYLHQKHY